MAWTFGHWTDMEKVPVRRLLVCGMIAGTAALALISLRIICRLDTMHLSFAHPNNCRRNLNNTVMKCEPYSCV